MENKKYTLYIYRDDYELESTFSKDFDHFSEIVNDLINYSGLYFEIDKMFDTILSGKVDYLLDIFR